MEARRYSRQREAILQNLQNRCDHPSADMVYESLREAMPNISLGTVYRNLNHLADDGFLLRFSVNGKEHFDGNTAPHIHFVCNRCNTISDVFHEDLSRYVHHIAGEMQCTVHSAQLVIHGSCKACHS